MRRINEVMAPVSSYQTCVQQIKAGANEIYVGMEDDTFNKISFQDVENIIIKEEK